jgi:cell division initiation protein
MALTPQDVEQKTFSTALRGYDLDEVDDFLDEIVATLRDLHEKLEQAETASASSPTTDQETPAPAVDESAVGRVLVTAQQTADNIVSDAKREAESLLEEAKTEAQTTLEEAKSEAATTLEEAKSEADNWVEQREAKRVEAEAEMTELSQHVSSVRTQLAVLATAVADRLDEMDESIASGVIDDVEEPDSSVVEADTDDGDEGEESDVPEDSETPGSQDEAAVDGEDESADETTSETMSHKPEIFVIGGSIDDQDDEDDGSQSDDSTDSESSQEDDL